MNQIPHVEFVGSVRALEPITGHTNADNDRYERMLLLISGVMRNEADELEQARDERARAWLAQLPAVQ